MTRPVRGPCATPGHAACGTAGGCTVRAGPRPTARRAPRLVLAAAAAAAATAAAAAAAAAGSSLQYLNAAYRSRAPPLLPPCAAPAGPGPALALGVYWVPGADRVGPLGGRGPGRGKP